MNGRWLIVLSLNFAGFSAAVSGQTTGIGGRRTGADPGFKPAPAKTETTFTIKVGPVRTWKNAEGIEITAELVSWPITDPKAATADPATLKFDIVRNGQIRLRKSGKISVLALTRLSEADRAYVATVEAATTKGAVRP